MRRIVLLAAGVVLALVSVGVTASPAAAATERATRCTRAAVDAGWTGGNLVISVAVALAESQCITSATHPNPANADCPNGSLDRGAWQINNCYHPHVSTACAFELYCNARAAYTIYTWSGWRAWTTYLNGAWRSYLGEAMAGIRSVTGQVYGMVTTGGGALTVRTGPSTGYPTAGSLADGSITRIHCQVRGQNVYSDVYGVWTDLWNRIGTGRYVSDAYVFTGTNGQVAPTC
jgi:Lysozyme like domain